MTKAERTFLPALLTITLVGLGLRIWAVMSHFRDLTLGFTDNFYYSVQADFIADGRGFSDPFVWEDTGRFVASADHPPLYSLYLSAFSWIGLDGPTNHRVASCLLGAGTVVVIGLIAKQLTGPVAGLVAAGIAALYPPLWIVDASLVAESPYSLLVALTILAALRVGRSPTWLSACLLGAVIGLAALTRSEGLMFLVLLAAPILLSRSQLSWPRRVGLLGLTAACAALLITPWFIRNQAHFAEPVPLAYGAGYVLKIGNCEQTYHGEKLGYWDIECAYAKPLLPDKSVAEQDARAQAMRFIRANAERVPAVVAARIGRLWHVYRVDQSLSYDKFFERRGHHSSDAALAAFYLVVPLAVVGFVRLRRDPVALVALLAMIIGATASAALAFGITRYRIAGDVALVIGAGVGVAHLVDRLGTRRPRSNATSTPP